MTEETRQAQPFPLLSDTDLSLDLGRQRHLAKKLRDGIRAGEPEALRRLAARHPRAARLQNANIKLTDAQLVVAREAGLPSWPALKAHVEEIEAARAAIEEGGRAPDDDVSTLHIRCGNDIEQALTRAGFRGDFLMVADPVCQGPVSDRDNAPAERARFIASEYPGEDEADTLGRLRTEDDRLQAAGSYGRIVLWFEHDPFDQLILAKILTRLRNTKAARRKVEIVTLDRFPGIPKFIGIGQLSPAALRQLYGRRQAVSDAGYDLAARVWSGLCAPTPLALQGLSSAPGAALPYMSAAIARYLAELPDLVNGLSFTENAILEILHAGPLPWGRVFGRFMREIDPLPYHGDLMFLGTMLRLRDARDPALTSTPGDLTEADWGKAVFNLTPTGRKILEGGANWRDCGPRPRQHGGVECFTGEDWRWDATNRRPLALGARP
ncbi:MAG: DUF1835 domain-containing protein [Hoeflea sp.]|uniref:DUF1835 domain-containing protein n=1 Tax=Hoeflea sp. TaxID=1940281 RepID=UPI0032F08E76